MRVGGVDLRDAEFVSLRRRIIVVPQEGFLFAGTLRDNVRVGRPEATDAEVEDALQVLGLLDRFAAFPEGLDTEVRERGSRLSAGERQLVSLARAALADPSVLILDEATSNLDPGTEHAVERALETLMHGRTVVVVAHRLSTAARADRIGVVFDGHLVRARVARRARRAGRSLRRAVPGVGDSPGDAGSGVGFSRMVATPLVYDPYDYAIDANPHPIWKRLRDEAPVYYNEQHDFYALSRFDDVLQAHLDPVTFSSAHTTVLEIMVPDPDPHMTSMMIFMDPPVHTRYRKLVSRAFTPRHMSALEPRIRALCAGLPRRVRRGQWVRLRRRLRRRGCPSW